MPLPRSVARFQRRFIHPLVRSIAAVAPGYGLLVHTGRKSGRSYRTPLNVFTVADGFAVVLAYGKDVDWLRNLRAAGAAEMIKRRKRYAISNPRIVSGAELGSRLPLYGRLIILGTRSPDVLLVDASLGRRD
jgi:deazaflavin-dependent oxidoreductase (nitroreductase family)